MALLFLLTLCIFQCSVVSQVGYLDNSMDNGANILALKRKASEVLNQRGITFDGDIAKIAFDSKPTILDMQITDNIKGQMLSILDEHLKYANDSQKLAVLNFTQVILTKNWEKKGIDGKNAENVTIEFAFDSGLSENEKTVIRDALHEIKRNMFWWCIRLSEIPFNKSRPETIIYLKSSDPAACGNAPIGKASSNMMIGLACINQQTVLRLTLHVLGLINSIWRADRDRFLTIDWSNINDKDKYNFYPWPFKYVRTLDGQEFDYESVLHFDYTSFAKNPTNPIVKFKQYEPEGVDGIRLSLMDIYKLRYNHSGEDEKSLDGEILNGAFYCSNEPFVDKQFSCPLWQTNGYCEQLSTSMSSEISKLQTECPYSCTKPGPSTPTVAPCEEISEFCLDWKNSGYCESTSVLYAYMKRVCPKSCNICY